MLKTGHLFAGIGGPALAARWMGWTPTFFAEVDPYASAVLAKNFPGVPNLGDVRLIKGQAGRIDVLTGGFPCQDISLAGRGAGIAEGTRSGLWSEYARLIGEFEPNYAAIENVSALRTRGLDRVLRDLDALGYDAEWHCVPASFVGAPQRRDRIVIVAYPSGSGVQGLGALSHSRQAGSWGWRGEEDLRAVAGAPFERGDRWPQPLLRRVDDGLSNRMDRLHALGNTVVPQKMLMIYQAIAAREAALAQG